MRQVSAHDVPQSSRQNSVTTVPSGFIIFLHGSEWYAFYSQTYIMRIDSVIAAWPTVCGIKVSREYERMKENCK